ncbi:MAG: hypothetical protein BGN86_10265 [Caulobacterales bacterium 68-7]|nr:MAG: hypothetical protein BGN86_10265 [Caulobacterales bacterium 68-7]
MRWTWAAVGALFFVQGIPAHAGDVECLFKLPPSPSIDQLAAAYRQGGVPAVTAVKNGVGYPAVLRCAKAPPSEQMQEFGRLIGRALAGYKLELATARVLADRGVTQAQLDKAMALYRPDGLKGVRIADTAGAPSDEARRAIEAALKRAATVLPPAAAEDAVYANYFFGRASREHFATRF